MRTRRFLFSLSSLALLACGSSPDVDHASHGGSGGGSTSSATTSSSSSSGIGSTRHSPFQYGGPLDEEVRTALMDAKNRFVIAGTAASDEVDFGAGPVPRAGSGNLFVAVVDAEGNPAIGKRYEAKVDDVSGVALTPDGGIVVTGEMSSPVTFGSTTLEPVGLADAFVVKIRADGSLEWAKNIGRAGAWTTGGALGVDGAGNVVSVTASELPDNTSPLLVTKLDPTGAVVLDVQEGDVSSITGGYAPVRSIAIDAAGDLYLYGTYAVTYGVTFSLGTPNDIGAPGGPSTGGGFAAKLSGADGSVVWSDVFEQADPEDIWADNLVLAGGDVFVSGSTIATGYLKRLAGADGSLVWQTSPADQVVGGLPFALAPSGDLVVLASVASGGTVGGAPAARGSWLATYHPNGDFVGVMPVPDVGDGLSRWNDVALGAIAIGKNGQMAIETSFYDTITTAQGPITSRGFGDALVVLVDP